jgi:hypothetical protein
LKPTPFVLAAFMTLGFGFAIAIAPTGIVALSCLVCLANFLIMFYLDGPAKSVTVRHDMLEVKNSIRRYVIPHARLLSIEYLYDFGVLVRVEGHEPIWVGAFSRSQIRWRRLSGGELEANAKSLTDALFATPALADHRPVEKGYRWANVLLIVAGAIGFLILNAVVN